MLRQQNFGFFFYFFEEQSNFWHIPLLLDCSSYAPSTLLSQIALTLRDFNPWSIALQIISAVSGGITDLSFNAVGYAWQIVNCILTAAYSVCLL